MSARGSSSVALLTASLTTTTGVGPATHVQANCFFRKGSSGQGEVLLFGTWTATDWTNGQLDTHSSFRRLDGESQKMPWETSAAFLD